MTPALSFTFVHQDFRVIIIVGMSEDAFVQIMNGVVDLEPSSYKFNRDLSSFLTRFLSNLSDFPIKFSKRFSRHSKWLSRSVSTAKKTPANVSLSMVDAEPYLIVPST